MLRRAPSFAKQPAMPVRSPGECRGPRSNVGGLVLSRLARIPSPTVPRRCLFEVQCRSFHFASPAGAGTTSTALPRSFSTSTCARAARQRVFSPAPTIPLPCGLAVAHEPTAQVLARAAAALAGALVRPRWDRRRLAGRGARNQLAAPTRVPWAPQTGLGRCSLVQLGPRG